LFNFPYVPVVRKAIFMRGKILGIGDQGVGGIGISTAKLVLMTLCAGVSSSPLPHLILNGLTFELGTSKSVSSSQ
jgi:hypothetical protein